jgi:hypothetical protein
MTPEQIARELLRRQADEKFRFYVPNGKIEDAIQGVGSGKRRVVILSAGNGVGKTAGGVNILANLFWPGQNQWFRGPLFENWPYPKRVRVVTEAKNVEEIGAIDQEIKTWWPAGRFTAQKAGKQFVSVYQTDTGWIMDKMSYQQDLTEFESATLGLVVFDEPPPKPIFDACRWRLRMGGLILILMTPLDGATWIFEEGGLLDDEDVQIIYADTEDACKVHGVRGHLEHDHIEKLLAGSTEEERQARKCGRPLSTINTVFGPSWMPEVHIIDDDTEPPDGSMFGKTIDPGDGKPYAIGWWWVDPRGHIVFDYNWPEENWIKVLRDKQFQTLTMAEYKRIFAQYEQGRHMEWNIMDRHYGNTRDGRTGQSLIEDWEDMLGVSFLPSYNCEQEIDTGNKMVTQYLKFNRALPLNGMNVPRLYVKRRCRNIIMSLPKWPYRIDENYRSLPDPKSAYKDFCDVVRYTCMLKPETYVTTPLTPTKASYVLGRA